MNSRFVIYHKNNTDTEHKYLFYEKLNDGCLVCDTSLGNAFIFTELEDAKNTYNVLKKHKANYVWKINEFKNDNDFDEKNDVEV